jgi:hypothetical protein
MLETCNKFEKDYITCNYFYCFHFYFPELIIFISRRPYELFIRIKDGLKRPLILDSGIIGLARAGEIVSYTRGGEANRINAH